MQEFTRAGNARFFRDYLSLRWETGCRHGRTLFTEIPSFENRAASLNPAHRVGLEHRPLTVEPNRFQSSATRISSKGQHD